MLVSPLLNNNTEKFVDTAPQKSGSARATALIWRSNVFNETGPLKVYLTSESSVSFATSESGDLNGMTHSDFSADSVQTLRVSESFV
jgi:hypothetical protein